MECLSSRREREAPGGRARENRKFIQAPSPEIWSETISGGEEVLAGKWGGLFLGYLLGKNFRRRDRDHLTPPRRMDAAVCRAEVCYPFGREHGRHRAMKRREFITLLGGAAAAWPLAASAQQGERMPRIGVLTSFASNDPAEQAYILAFTQALAQSGWIDGRNARIDIRWGAGDPEHIRRYAAELVALAPGVILAVSSAATGPLLQATRTVPVVFVEVGE